MQRLRHHLDAIAGAERDQGLHFDPMVRDQAQAIALCECAQNKRRPGEGKLASDAGPRTAAEGKIGVLRPFGAVLRREAL